MLRFLTTGESHGPAVIGLVESFPAGFKISLDGINHQLARRQQGFGRGGRMRIERDTAVILSGLRHGRTLGSPIACLVANRDWPNWKKIMDPTKPPAKKMSDRERRLMYETVIPRPGHADLAGAIKYDTHDLRNVLERASARETAARVACGAMARQLLEHFAIRIASHVVAIGTAHRRHTRVDFDEIMERADDSPVRCIDPAVADRMVEQIKQARRAKDTLGGIFEVRVINLPVGLGSNAQWSTRLDGALAAALMSIPSVKGVEIGEGFAGSRKRGSRVHDQIYYVPGGAQQPTKGFVRRTNMAGGLEGGMTNGAELIVRAACKPIATLRQPLSAVDLRTKQPRPAIVERSDTCVVPAAAVVGEAMVAMALASAFSDKFGGDSRAEMEANFDAYLRRPF